MLGYCSRECECIPGCGLQLDRAQLESWRCDERFHLCLTLVHVDVVPCSWEKDKMVREIRASASSPESNCESATSMLKAGSCSSSSLLQVPITVKSWLESATLLFNKANESIRRPSFACKGAHKKDNNLATTTTTSTKPFQTQLFKCMCVWSEMACMSTSSPIP